ncbi:31917_t:CDS:1, partial [Racocetra persica]
LTTPHFILKKVLTRTSWYDEILLQMQGVLSIPSKFLTQSISVKTTSQTLVFVWYPKDRATDIHF